MFTVAFKNLLVCWFCYCCFCRVCDMFSCGLWAFFNAFISFFF